MRAAWMFILSTLVVFDTLAAEKDAAILYELPMSPTPVSRIDGFVSAKLQRLGIPQPRVCSDAVFVRRVYLDVIGTLPTAEEARAFLEDKSMNKRRALIERLLARDEFADYWAMKWADLLRVKAEFPINLWPNAVQAYHRWIRASIAENKPYDRFARELLTASGSNFRAPPVNFYRAMQNKTPEGIARAVALTFMGARTDRWRKDQVEGMAAIFSQLGYKATGEWKEEIVFFDATKPAPAALAFPDGSTASPAAERDPREQFADWLCTPRNPWFTAAICNRVWSWLLGRGIIHEVDDIRTGNAPCNGDLICHLRDELIEARYDLKHLFRIILNSRTYQASSIARSTHPEAEANFAHYPMRRLEAEVLIDALNQITGTTERYASPIPEPFTFIPEDQRSVALADGSITSAFLELFGRSSRDTGMEGERNSRVTAAQRLHLLNSSHIQKKIEQGPKMQALLRAKGNSREKLTALYFTILSRPPMDEELKIAEAYLQAPSGERRDGALDVAWALLNSAEFLHRH